MNESNQGVAPQSPSPAQEVAPQIQQPMQQPIQETTTLPQSRIDEIVRDAFNRGREKGKSEIAPAGSISGLSHDDYRKIAREEAEKANKSQAEEWQRQQQIEAARKSLEEIDGKLAATSKSGKYPDFDQTIKELGLENMQPLLHYANMVDNSGDLLYDLGKNPMKLAMLNSLPPHRVTAEIKKLSDSIKQNDQAEKSTKLPPDPFGNIKPSSGAGIGKRPSEMSASEWRQHYKGRVRAIGR